MIAKQISANVHLRISRPRALLGQEGGMMVLVTGGSGYLASWVLVALLKRGHRVRATLRSRVREHEVRAAVATQVDAQDRLSFAVADLLKDDGWRSAAEGCDAVLHVASPMATGSEVIVAAREGTRRVLAASAQAGVRRVVMTSSVVATQPRGGFADAAIDESVWTDSDERGLNDYVVSKTLAERDAWAFAAAPATSLQLTSILPGFIIGPVLGPDFSRSLEIVARLLTGKLPLLPRIGFTITDVRDLAELHVDAVSSPRAEGERFIATLPTRAMPDFLMRTLALFSDEARMLARSLGRRSSFSADKAQRFLGWRARPVEQTVLDCAESLIAARRSPRLPVRRGAARARLSRP
jgi:dihydroflavonol-4-reductase